MTKLLINEPRRKRGEIITILKRIGATLSILFIATAGSVTYGIEEDGFTTAYLVARTTGNPYQCTFKIPSFMGEYSHYEAEIIGDDFLVVDVTPSEVFPANKETSSHYVRKGNMGYYWLFSYMGESKPLSLDNAKIFDYSKIQKAFKSLIEEAQQIYPEEDMDTIPEFQILLFYVPPPLDAVCKRVEKVVISVPEILFFDATQDMLSVFNNPKVKIENKFNYLGWILSPDWEDRLKEEYKELTK